MKTQSVPGKKPLLFSKPVTVCMHDMRTADEDTYPFVTLVPTVQHTQASGFHHLAAHLTARCARGLREQR